MRAVRRRALTVIAVCAATVSLVASPAAAGGTWLEFDGDIDSVAVGDAVRGGAWVHPGAQGTADDGPFDVYLRPETDETEPRDDLAVDRVGPLAELRIGERSGPLVHVEVEFVVPDVPPGVWWVDVCNAGCETGLGDLIGGRITVVAPAAAAAAGTLPETGLHAALLAAGAGLLGSGILLRRAVSRRGR